MTTNPRIKEIVAKYVYQESIILQEEEELDYIALQKKEKQEAIYLAKDEIYEVKEEEFEDNEESFIQPRNVKEPPS